MEDVEDVAMPPAKKLRVDQSDTQNLVPENDLEDDTQDLYGTPPSLGKSAAHNASNGSTQPSRLSPASSVPQKVLFNLPGLNVNVRVNSQPEDSDGSLRERSQPPSAGGAEPATTTSSPETGENLVQEELKNIMDQDDSKTLTANDVQDPSNNSAISDMTVPRNPFHSNSSEHFQGPQETMVTTEETNGVIDHGSSGVATEQLLDDSLDLPSSTQQAIEPGTNESTKTKVSNTTSQENAEANEDIAEAEFEIDSSPYETSSSDASSGSSSSEDSSDDYELLDPEEQARRLMQEDGGSDDEGFKKGAGALSGPLRTLHEKPDEIVPKPDVTVTSDMKIEELGIVENLVENVVLVKAKISGEYRVLETGSVLCLDDRTVIGAIAETLGKVQEPHYSIRFTNSGAISEANISKGTRVFYVERYSTYVFTQPLKSFKGSDASNIHDEEVGDDELEFSDDEAEAEYKRKIKVQKQAKREGRQSNTNGFSRGPHGGSGSLRATQDAPMNFEDTAMINYDENGNDDELYTPLARPSNLHEIMGSREAPTESSQSLANGNQSSRGARHRNDRGRPRGDHGRGGGRRNDRGDRRNGSRGFPEHSNGTTRPTQDLGRRQENSGVPPSPQQIPFSPSLPPGLPFTPQPFSPQNPLSYQSQSYQPENPHGYGLSFEQPQHQPASAYQSQQYSPQPPPSFFGHYGQQQYTPHPQPKQQQFASHQPPAPNPPPGAFVNPAFFGHQPHHSSIHQYAHSQSPMPSYPSPSNQSSYMNGYGGGPQQAHATSGLSQEAMDLLRQLSNRGPGSSR